MRKYIIFSVLCILSIWVIYSLKSFFAPAPSFTVVQIYEEAAVGDKNQVIGVVHALKKHTQNLTIMDYSCNEKTDISKLVNDISDPKKDKLVIGVGKTAFSVFDQLSAKNIPNIKTLALGHQWTTAYSNLLGKVTWIAVPDYARQESLINTSTTKLIYTNGVPHAVTQDTLRIEYESYKKKLPLTINDHVIILGGDAPTNDGTQKRFTEADASELAIALFNEKSVGTFYVVNGPRTGKFDKDLNEIKNIHRDERIDAVTIAFIETLKKKGVPENRIKLYDFKFGKKSFYIPLLAAAFVYNAPVWVPGESSSMICEAISVIAPNNLIIYDNQAMNETHKKHVDSVYKQGRARHYSNGKIKTLATKDVTALPDARDQIAHVITETKLH